MKRQEFLLSPMMMQYKLNYNRWKIQSNPIVGVALRWDDVVDDDTR
jgi:hypothetical protein